MDREVGLSDDDHSADSERVELVEDDVDDGCLGPLRRLDQGPLDGLEAVDGVRVAIEHLEQQVSSQSVQSFGPPFIDPFIYRTSPATLSFASRLRSEKISLPQRNLFHCRVRFDPLQEKNAFLTPESSQNAAASERG